LIYIDNTVRVYGGLKVATAPITDAGAGAAYGRGSVLQGQRTSGAHLRIHAFTRGSVVVSAGLTIFGRIHCQSFVLDNLASRLERGKLPTHEGIIVRVCLGGDERAAPVDSTAHELQVFLGNWGKVSEPVLWVPTSLQPTAWSF
jgi:hypothetical protein